MNVAALKETRRKLIEYSREAKTDEEIATYRTAIYDLDQQIFGELRRREEIEASCEKAEELQILPKVGSYDDAVARLTPKEIIQTRDRYCAEGPSWLSDYDA